MSGSLRAPRCARWSRRTATDMARCRRPRAALRGGASVLAVATAREAAELRQAGLDAPILVLGALSDEELPVAVAARRRARRLGSAVRRGVRRLLRRGQARRSDPRQARHRPRAAGTRDPDQALAAVARRCRRRRPRAPAGGRDDPLRHRRRRPRVRGAQLREFGRSSREARAARGQPRSPGTPPTARRSLRVPHSHFDMVRVPGSRSTAATR